MRVVLRAFVAIIVPIILAILVFGWAFREHSDATAAATNTGISASLSSTTNVSPDPRLSGAYRFTDHGWIYVHVHGSPEQIGFQHGYLLAPEILDAFDANRLQYEHGTKKPWTFFQKAAHDMLWPKIDAEYQAELKGIVEGLHAHGVNSIEVDDIVAFNAFLELSDYYVPWYSEKHKIAGSPRLTSQGNCSGFVATGSYTKTHDIVMAHNNWTNYVQGERWRIIFDIVPQHGYRILMDGYPGVITSDDDFGVNSDGLMVTETTISQFNGWDPNGIPEFERSRKALQYSGSIDDYVRIMNEGNNGGYANDWLLGDRKTGEIARFEQGLKHTRVWRTKDGYFVGSNFPSDPQVTKDETTFNVKDMSNSANARHVRWNQLMAEYKGKIDTNLAEKFESDHFDSYTKKEGADSRTLCGHADTDPNGVPIWDWGGYYPGGAVQGKVMDSEMAAKMELIAHLGHPCGANFYAKPFLKAHPEYSWEASILRDMPAYPWTEFSAGEHANR
ncbi:MAG TPA: C45 family peptidase [Candidatus Acidoferrales bacterium]|nr:C45 family peptidase [Candidatus Acidoferrales bacterium]